MARVYTSIASLLVVITSSSMVCAQEAWPTYPLSGHRIVRGPGSYFAWWKLLLLWLLFLLWVKTTDWINRDSQLLKLNHNFWNPINFFPFFVVFFVLALSIAFPIGYAALILSWLAPLGVYIYQRNANAEQHEKVLTAEHLRHMMARAGKSMGLNIETEKSAAHERGAPVTFKPTSGKTKSKNEANLILARQSEGFVPTKELVADALDRRGMKIMLDTDSEQVTVRYQIDGVWHEADPMERDIGDVVVEVIKKLSGADSEERRKRQSGEFSLHYKKDKCRAVLVSQGTKTGERTIINLAHDGMEFDNLGEAGLRDKLQDRLRELLIAKNGLILFSSVPGGGLSTTVALAGKMSDRYMRDFLSFQDINKPEPVAENIAIETYDTETAKVQESLQTLFRKDPDVVIVHELVDKGTVDLICERAVDDKLVLATIGAKEAVEALLRVLLLKVSAKTFAPAVIGVINQRLIRKLCEECKEEYAPSADLLKKLGIPKGRVEAFFRPPTPDENDPICAACSGLGYFGRTSIFELLTVDDSIREALVKQPKLEVLRKVAKKAGHRTLQDEGMLLVVQGITSLTELTRILKQ